MIDLHLVLKRPTQQAVQAKVIALTIDESRPGVLRKAPPEPRTERDRGTEPTYIDALRKTSHSLPKS